MGWSSSVYRLGGEEFLLLIEDPPENVCEHIRACHGQLPQVFEGVPDQIHYSIGVALATPDDTLSSLLKKADIALYYVKRNGRNAVACFDDLPPEIKQNPKH
ncbi:GGDEF domain-containing protein [Sulfurivirga caldicuralii]|uniref:GGDEF domain-containing protein n=1 Tax=Sulfurivirga caldicuralii TaxID=364032 RepID=UPI00094189FE